MGKWATNRTSHFPVYVNESYKGIHIALGTFFI
jgi:hypothetical protein